MPPRPSLPDEVIEEILLRVAPDDPASLVRAAITCRRWCGLVADQSFHRRRLALHGATLPILGVLCSAPDIKQLQFVSTSSFRPRPPCAGDHDSGLQCFDARHGRALLHGRSYRDFIVWDWDPVTDNRVELPSLPCALGNGSMKATVLCAATGVRHCDHLDYHRGPFNVVLVGTNDVPVYADVDEDDMVFEVEEWVEKDMFSCIYSSETGSWSEPKYAPHPGDNVDWMRSALVGNSLFFALSAFDRILKYDLGTQEMSVEELPDARSSMLFGYIKLPIQVTTLEDGRFGFARVEESNQLCLWSRDGADEDAGWTLYKVIDLNDLFPQAESNNLKYSLVGFAEIVCVAFVAVQGGLFGIDMKSGLMKEVYDGRFCCAVPYFDFCTPALPVPSIEDGSRKNGDAAPMATADAPIRRSVDCSTRLRVDP